jgi:hypothetical protein
MLNTSIPKHICQIKSSLPLLHSKAKTPHTSSIPSQICSTTRPFQVTKVSSNPRQHQFQLPVCITLKRFRHLTFQTNKNLTFSTCVIKNQVSSSFYFLSINSGTALRKLFFVFITDLSDASLLCQIQEHAQNLLVNSVLRRKKIMSKFMPIYSFRGLSHSTVS